MTTKVSCYFVTKLDENQLCGLYKDLVPREWKENFVSILPALWKTQYFEILWMLYHHFKDVNASSEFQNM